MNDRAPIGGRWGLSRRASLARRDANLALIGALFAGALLAFALLLLLLARVDAAQGARVRGAIGDLLSPLTRILMAPARAIGGVRDRVGDHFATVGKLQAAEAELAALRRRIAEGEAVGARLAEAEALLRLRRAERRLIVSAEASALAATGAARQAVLAAGSRHGVRPRMPAIGAQGLAGRVTDVGLVSARVMLLSDPNSRVPVRVERTGWTGIAAGTGDVDLLFLFDPASATDRLKRGDRLVTSGDGGLFPPGLPVAVVVDAQSNPPRARPFVRPAALGVLSIEAPWLPPPEPEPVAPAPDEADLPPAPVAVPAPLGAAGTGAPPAPPPVGAAP